jgi:hypothetical protein
LGKNVQEPNYDTSLTRYILNWMMQAKSENWCKQFSSEIVCDLVIEELALDKNNYDANLAFLS